MNLPELAAALGDVRRAKAFRYGARDDRNVTLDCLKIAAVGGGKYLGVSHALSDGVFHLNLSVSKNLMDWRFVATLADHASQGELRRLENGGFLLAYEHDAPNSCNVRLRRYADRAALETGRFSEEATIARTLAPTAEGTPSFERVAGETIDLRFHYYRSGDVDRAARGTLRNFRNWSAAPDEAVNHAIERFGVRGNIGGRSRFTFGGQTYYAQEGQLAKNDWSSWRVFLMDDSPTSRAAVPLPVRTHKGSRSFANPSVTVLPDGQKTPPRFFVSLFLPSQGSAPGEAGALIYTVDAPPAGG